MVGDSDYSDTFRITECIHNYSNDVPSFNALTIINVALWINMVYRVNETWI